MPIKKPPDVGASNGFDIYIPEDIHAYKSSITPHGIVFYTQFSEVYFL